MAFSDPAATGLAIPPAGRWTKVHRGLLLVALGVLVVAGQGQHFFFDEWAFLGGQLDALRLTDRYLLPHNEHWTLLPLLAYRTLRSTVGVTSYWPYLGLLLLLHLGVTHLLWRLMLVTGSKPIVATALAAVFSVLGAAAEDLVWAFQIAFVGATLLGVGAIYLAVTGTASWRKTVVLAALILASLATSGVGLAYLVVVPLILWWRRRRYAVVAFGVPLLIYAAWYAANVPSLTHPPQASAALPLMVGAFVTVGMVAALAGYVGFGNNMASFLLVGVPLLAGLTLACRGWQADRSLTGRTFLAMCAGTVTFFGTAGLARAGAGLGMAMSSRYVYVAIALLLPAVAFVISRGTDRHPGLVRVILPVALAMTVSNVSHLLTFAAETRQHSNASRKILTAASDLVTGNSPIFVNQLPEPVLAPDLTTRDLRPGRLDAVFEGVSPQQPDRLAASLNLQIRVAPAPESAGTSTCRGTPERRITIPTSRQTAPRFRVKDDASVTLTLRDTSSTSSRRMIDLPSGTYLVTSLREAADLTIESTSPASILARC